MSVEETKREMEIAEVEVRQEREIMDKADEIMAAKQRPLIDFGKSVGAAATASMFGAFAKVVQIQSLKSAQEFFSKARVGAVGTTIDGCKSFSAYCDHHGISRHQASMDVRLLEAHGEDFIRNAYIIGLARSDYRILMALPSGDQSDLIQTITSIEIQSVEQAREVKEQFRSALEIFQEKLTEKDELLKAQNHFYENAKAENEKLKGEKEKRQSTEEELLKVTSERDLYATGDRPSHSLEQIKRDLEEAKARFKSAFNITRSLNPDNHESLAEIRLLLSWFTDEVEFTSEVIETRAIEIQESFKA